MADESIKFDVSPKLVQADAVATITIRPIDHAGRFEESARYEVTYFPVEEFASRSGWPRKNKPDFRVVDGRMMITQYFEAEQEHVLLVEALVGGQPVLVGNFRIYSLEADLHARGVFKGDFHIHSDRRLSRQKLFQKSGLSPGMHTLKIVVKGTKQAAAKDTHVVIDAFDVQPGPATP